MKMTARKKSNFNPRDVSRIRMLSRTYEKELLQLLGFGNVSSRGVQQSCPVHGGDNRTAFSYDLNRHCWSCFSQHCERKYGNDIIGLVRGVRNLSFNDAVSWLKEILLDNKTIDWSKIDENIDTENLHTIHKKEYNRPIDETKLESLVKDYSSLADRGFSEEVFKTFEGGLSLAGESYHHRFMIPIRNDIGHIVAFTGRTVYPKCDKCGLYHKDACPSEIDQRHYSKWRHYPPFFRKHIELYNIDKAKDYIYKTNTAILVEGPFDVWKLWQFGIKNVVAAFGTKLSSEQMLLLAKYSCINLILMFDSDEAGLKAIKDTTALTKSIFRVYAPKLPDNIDPGELGLSEYNNYIKPVIDNIMKVDT